MYHLNESDQCLYTFSTSGGATTTAPSSWGNKSLESIFQTKYSKPITTYWPYGTSKGTTPQTKDHGLPTWAAAVIGVLCGLFGVGVILAAIWFYLRRRRGHGPLSSKPDNTHAIDNNEERKIMYASGPASPGPGPVSNSTGIETRTNDSMMQDSINTSISPRTVESGGGAVYEMHGKKESISIIAHKSPLLIAILLFTSRFISC